MVFKKLSSCEQLLTPTESCPLISDVPNQHPLSSAKRTFANILITVVGASVMGLPYTFKQVGWLAGIIIVGLAGLASYYCMMLLVWCKRRLERGGTRRITSYGDLGFHVYGKLGRAAVDTLVVISQAGFCVGYVVFIGDTLASIFGRSQEYTVAPVQGSWHPGGADLHLGGSISLKKLHFSSFLGLSLTSKPLYVCIVFPFQVALSAIRSVTHLAPFSLFADVADVLAMGVVILKEMQIMERGGAQYVEAFTSFAALPFAVGVGIYAFEGISMVIALETAMEHKHRFEGVLGLAFFIITCLYSIFGAMGYLAYGNDTREIITLNLGTSRETVIIQLALCIGLFFTFPLMMNPVYEIVERRFQNKNPSLGLRSLVVLITCIVAAAVPNFTDFLSLAGSSVCCILGFIFPAVMHLSVLKGEYPWYKAAVDYLLIMFGMFFGVMGTITALGSMC